MNLRKDHYRAKKTLVKCSLREPLRGRPRSARPAAKGRCSSTGPVVGFPAVATALFPHTTGLSGASVGDMSSSSDFRALVRRRRRPALLIQTQTNGILLASTPEPRVTVAFPSTVLMARRQFPPLIFNGRRSSRLNERRPGRRQQTHHFNEVTELITLQLF